MPPGWAFPVVAFVSTFALAHIFGDDIRGTRHALEATARFSYLWFLIAYAGSALATQLRTKFLYGREFGLAFAASHSVHLMLVIRLYHISPTSPTALFGLNGAIFGAVGFALMYLMAILSIRRIALAMSVWAWRTVLFFSMEYIAFAFVSDFWRNAYNNQPYYKLALWYFPFIALGLLAMSLRLLRLGQRYAIR